MTTEPSQPTESKKLIWAGRILSGLTALLLLFSAAMKLSGSEDVVKEFARLGYPAQLVIGIGITELVITIIYIVPQTAVLGAILLTGYLGGATATHVRVGDPYFGPILIGVVLWLGLFLRDRRLRTQIPLRALLLVLFSGNF